MSYSNPVEKFSTSRRVEFHETDMAGIVHFSNYFVWMEQAEHELWRHVDSGVVTHVDGKKLSWPRVAAECNYRRALRFEDVITLHVWITRLGEKSVSWSFDFFHADEKVAEGTLTTVCCEIEHGKSPVSTVIPASIRERLERYVWNDQKTAPGSANQNG